MHYPKSASPFSSNPAFFGVCQAFQKKDNQKARIEEKLWTLDIRVSVSTKLATLFLFKAVNSLSCFSACYRQNTIELS